MSKNMSVQVNSRKARVSYGTLCNILPWDADEHDPADKVWSNAQQTFLAVDQTQWFVHIVRSTHSVVYGKAANFTG